MARGKTVSSKKQDMKLSKKAAVLIPIGILLIVLAGLGLGLWYHYLHSNPERVFWAMINNNLSTPSVTKEIDQAASGSTSLQTIQLSFNGQTAVHQTTRVVSPQGKAAVEGVATLTDDYQHFTQFDKTGAAKHSQAEYNQFYNMWFHSGSTAGQASSPSMFSKAAFTGVLFANLTPANRAELVRYLKDHNVYQIDFTNVPRSNDNNKDYVYTAVVGLQNYAAALHLYATDIGLPGSDSIKPTDYQPTDLLRLKLNVDPLSRQLTKITYEGQAGTTTELYSNYGVVTEFAKPSNIVDSQTFQKAFQSISQ